MTQSHRMNFEKGHKCHEIVLSHYFDPRRERLDYGRKQDWAMDVNKNGL